MVKGGKIPSSSAAGGKTPAPNATNKGGKPRQQDEKAIDETFEPLKLDVKGAQTAVVCLQSTEDNVLIRACDSLFKFADKSDGNKLLLHEMGATDTLFTLTHHANPIVQRNATMVFGVMSAHPDIRRHLRKIDCIPHMVSLLSSELEPLTNEFAVFWLRHMCNDYSTKSQVLSLNVLPSLIRLISENDPDIKFNSLSTIDHILDDYHARSLVRELNGIEPILNNLKSDYPQITETVCNCLQKLATDPYNRAVIRDIGGLDKMIDFIGLDDTKDVHVHCLNALANLLEDTECLDLIQSNGGLKRLMQFVQDSVVPAVQAAAAKAIGRAARKRLNTGPEPQNRKIFAEQDAERAMVFLLISENDEVRIAACQALAVMAESMLSRETIRNNDGILTLVQMMQKDNPRLREFSTLAMSNLTQSNPNNIRELQDQGGLEVLVRLLNDEKDTTKAYACVTIANCSTDQLVRTNLLDKGLINNLLAPLQANYEIAQAKAAMVLSAFGIDQKARQDVLNNEALIPRLVNLLKSNNDEVRRNACFAVSVLCTEQTIAIEILRNGALEIVRDLNTSESRKSKFTEMALQKILDSHLSAKYSYLGRLENNNITADGFYDMGPIRDGGKFLTIEELATQEVNDRRPILIVYAAEKNGTRWTTTGGSQEEDRSRAPFSSDDNISTSATPAKGTENKEKLSTIPSGRSAKTPKGSNKDKDGKSSVDQSSRSKKDKTSDKRDAVEDKKNNETDTTGTNGADSKAGYKATPDQDFQMYLDEIQPQVSKTPLSEQISTLARFVSEKMGGKISPDDISTFGYEVAMNQLKAELHSNVVPIGRVRKGIHAQRAFLFKTLADRLGIPCTLTRGNYNRAWNEVILGESSGGVRYPAKTWIVDLLHEPGRLIMANSSDARIYTTLS